MPRRKRHRAPQTRAGIEEYTEKKRAEKTPNRCVYLSFTVPDQIKDENLKRGHQSPFIHPD
jgi:hypothetical protein